MIDTNSKLLRQEVEELTAMLRTEKYFERVRTELTKKGFSPHAVLLAGFIEDEDGSYETGAIVTKEGQIFEYKWKKAKGNESFHWEDVRSPSDLADSYEAVEIALKMNLS